MHMLRKWVRDWALIDIVVLGIGLFLTGGFIWYRQNNPTDTSPIIDLWPNVATEIIAIYLGVRFIDSLISRREHRNTCAARLIRWSCTVPSLNHSRTPPVTSSH